MPDLKNRAFLTARAPFPPLRAIHFGMTDNNSEKANALNAAVQALDDKKAGHITVLDLDGKTNAARYFIIASGTSSTHLRALRNALDELWRKRFGCKLVNKSIKESPWQVVDAGEIVVHLFTAEERLRYNLEALWGDAKLVQVAQSA